jgi:hypothetical protein
LRPAARVEFSGPALGKRPFLHGKEVFQPKRTLDQAALRIGKRCLAAQVIGDRRPPRVHILRKRRAPIKRAQVSSRETVGKGCQFLGFLGHIQLQIQ